ncbi:MAG: 30S ribosomal protein S4 [Candidatus Paceibacterota bacterium]|jgi:small subunit ribosomal protein S4
MINGPKYKICRRLGSGVFEKCQTQKFILSEAKRGKKNKRPKALTDFGVQLIEKQKIRYTYGLSEKQFSNYVKEAEKVKGISISDKLFELLESRLDNVVYVLGFANSKALARQMVSHGHFTVNGKKLTIPSYQVKIKDIVKVREGSKGKVLFADMAKKLKNQSIPNWIKFNLDNLEAEITGKPKNVDSQLNFGAVFEFYSR